MYIEQKWMVNIFMTICKAHFNSIVNYSFNSARIKGLHSLQGCPVGRYERCIPHIIVPPRINTKYSQDSAINLHFSWHIHSFAAFKVFYFRFCSTVWLNSSHSTDNAGASAGLPPSFILVLFGLRYAGAGLLIVFAVSDIRFWLEEAVIKITLIQFSLAVLTSYMSILWQHLQGFWFQHGYRGYCA